MKERTDLEKLTDSTSRLSDETHELNKLISRFLVITNTKRTIFLTATITLVSVLLAITAFVMMSNYCQPRDGVCDLLIPVSTEEVVADILQGVEEVGPFGEYPNITIAGPQNQMDGLPSFNLNETISIPLRSQFCIEQEGGLLTSGQAYWITTNPRGSVVEIGSYVVERPEGCVPFDFMTDIPDGVVERTDELLSEGVDSVTWRLSGTDRAGQSVAPWVSDEFILFRE